MSSKIENLIKNRYGWCVSGVKWHQPIWHFSHWLKP